MPSKVNRSSRCAHLILVVSAVLLAWQVVHRTYFKPVPSLPFMTLLGPIPVKDTISAYTRQGHEERFHMVLAPVLHDEADTGDVCRMLMSGTLLNWPAATTAQSTDPSTTTDIERLGALLDYLSNSRMFQGGDLLMVAHGRKFWFQLPPEVLVRRWLKMVIRRGTQTWNGDKDTTRWSDTVIISTNADSSLDDSAHFNFIIGPLDDMRRMYGSVLHLMSSNSSVRSVGMGVDILYHKQQTFHQRLETQGFSWWQAHMAGLPGIRWANVGTRRAVAAQQDLETNLTFRPSFGVIADKDNELFGVLDLHSNVTSINVSDKYYQPLRAELEVSRQPFVKDDLSDPLAQAASTFIPIHAKLDSLPWSHLSWQDVQLQSISQGSRTSIPPIMDVTQLPSNDIVATETWNRAWFHANGRALLRHSLVRPQPFVHVSEIPSTSRSAQRSWDHQGGRGGIWQGNQWRGWKKLCRGQEDYVFGDGLGPWGGEQGGNRSVLNNWGAPVTEE